MFDWRKSTWGEEISLEYGKALAGYDRPSGPVRVYGSNGPIGWTDKALCQGPGIVLGRKGAYRGIEFSRGPFHVIDTAYYVRRKTDLDLRWLYYAMIYHRLGEIDDGSPVPSTTRAAVYVRELHVPTKAEQKDIGSVLGSVDDKIDNNKQLRASLEKIAATIFKDWFVDFGPVKAKLNGISSYLNQEIWSLFPGVIDETYDVPEGWRAGCLGEIAHPRGVTIQPNNVSEQTPYIGLEHMPRKSLSLMHWESAKKVTSAKSVFHKGDTLFGKLRPYFHKVGIAPVDGICSTDIVVITPRHQNASALVTMLVGSGAFVAYTDRTSSGTKMPRTNWDTMSAYPIAIAPPELLQAFEKVVGPLLDRVLVSIQEYRRLASIRDTILPKLLSGEWQVAEAKMLAEAA